MELPIPRELTPLINSGFWPRDGNEANKQNSESLVPESIIRGFAPEESKIYFEPPPFATVANLMKGQGRIFWADPHAAIQEIDPELTLIIGDFGIGSDAPLALDYRQDLYEPRVIRLRWAENGNHWVEIAPNFADFVRHLGR